MFEQIITYRVVVTTKVEIESRKTIDLDARIALELLLPRPPDVFRFRCDFQKTACGAVDWRVWRRSLARRR